MGHQEREWTYQGSIAINWVCSPMTLCHYCLRVDKVEHELSACMINEEGDCEVWCDRCGGDWT